MAFTINGKEVILLGDTTTHGGEVVTASSNFSHLGIPVARVGDMVTCPKCEGTFPIIEGAPTASENHNNIARHGDKVACGATLISRGNAQAQVSSGFFGTRQNLSPQGKEHIAKELCSTINNVMQSKSVQKALEKADRLTKETGHEYAGWIVETSPGVYEIPELYTSGEAMTVAVPNAPKGTIGHFHTHTEAGMPSFSPHDRDFADRRAGVFDMVTTYVGTVYQDRTGNNIVCDPALGGPRICGYSGDDEFNPNPDDPGCW